MFADYRSLSLGRGLLEVKRATEFLPFSLWNNIKSAGELSAGSNYHIFKLGIEPKWEDKANLQGGKWLVTFKSGQRQTSLNQLWLSAVCRRYCLTF